MLKQLPTLVLTLFVRRFASSDANTVRGLLPYESETKVALTNLSTVARRFPGLLWPMVCGVRTANWSSRKTRMPVPVLFVRASTSQTADAYP